MGPEARRQGLVGGSGWGGKTLGDQNSFWLLAGSGVLASGAREINSQR